MKNAHGYHDADGVQVAIQLEGAELWSSRTVAVTDFRDSTSARILADDYATHSPTGVDNVQVRKGDRIYFRVQSVFDGSYDRVAWDPRNYLSRGRYDPHRRQRPSRLSL